MREGIPAKLLIDADALAALRGAGASPDSSALLEKVAALLADVRSRLDGDARILIDQNEAAKLMGCSAKTLQNHRVPHVPIGSRRMYRTQTLREWAAQQEGAQLEKGTL